MRYTTSIHNKHLDIYHVFPTYWGHFQTEYVLSLIWGSVRSNICPYMTESFILRGLNRIKYASPPIWVTGYSNICINLVKHQTKDKDNIFQPSRSLSQDELL